MSNLSGSFLRLVSIMDDLREKCPWDRKQNDPNFAAHDDRETYELVDAITDEDWRVLKKN
jgi:XTP/dITP diphosphohydrolase